MPPRKGQPNRRGIARREQILDAAVELFAHQGYRGTGVLALAERVGISHPGILRYFGSKEGLLRAVMERRYAALDEFGARVTGGGILALLQAVGEPEPEVLTRLSTVLMAENLDAGDPLNEYFQEHNQRYRSMIAAEIRVSQARGEVRADIDPDLKAAEIVSFAIGVETQWLLNPTDFDREAVQRSFTASLLADLAPQQPRRRTARQPERRSAS